MADERYQSITVRMLLDHSSGLMGGQHPQCPFFDDYRSTGRRWLLRRLPRSGKVEPGAYCVTPTIALYSG